MHKLPVCTEQLAQTKIITTGTTTETKNINNNNYSNSIVTSISVRYRCYWPSNSYSYNPGGRSYGAKYIDWRSAIQSSGTPIEARYVCAVLVWNWVWILGSPVRKKLSGSCTKWRPTMYHSLLLIFFSCRRLKNEHSQVVSTCHGNNRRFLCRR